MGDHSPKEREPQVIASKAQLIAVDPSDPIGIKRTLGPVGMLVSGLGGAASGYTVLESLFAGAFAEGGSMALLGGAVAGATAVGVAGGVVTGSVLQWVLPERMVRNYCEGHDQR